MCPFRIVDFVCVYVQNYIVKVSINTLNLKLQNDVVSDTSTKISTKKDQAPFHKYNPLHIK